MNEKKKMSRMVRENAIAWWVEMNASRNDSYVRKHKMKWNKHDEYSEDQGEKKNPPYSNSLGWHELWKNCLGHTGVVVWSCWIMIFFFLNVLREWKTDTNVEDVLIIQEE